MRRRGLGASTAPLVERDREVALLTDALDRVLEGRGSLVVVAGPSGIGRSRLLVEAEELAEARDAEVLRGTGSEDESGMAFGLVLQLFERALLRRPDDDRDRLLVGAAARCRALFEHGPAAGEDIHAVVHGLYWLAVNLAERRPLTLVVDDAHLADEPSLLFLGYLAGRLDELPIGVIVGARTDEASGRSLLEHLRRRTPVLIEPAPLTEDGIGAVVRHRTDADASPRFLSACHRTTGGNPLLVDLLLTQVLARGDACDERTAAHLDQLAPTEVLATIDRQLTELDPIARRLAGVLATLGPIDLGVLAAATGLAPGPLAVGLDDLRAAGLLAPSDTPALAHALARSAVLADLDPGERQTLHERCVDALWTHGRRPERIAPLLLDVPPRGDPRVVTTLREAAASASAADDPDAADRYLRRALAEPPAADDLAPVLAEAAAAAARVESEDAVQLHERAIGAAGDEGATPLQIGLARHLVRRGDAERALDVLDAAVATAGPGDAELLQAASVQLSRFVPHRRRSARTVLDQLVQNRHQLPSGEQRAVLAIAAYEAAISGDDRAEASALAAAALAGGERAAVLSLGSVPLVALGLALRFVEDTEASRALFDEAVEHARASGSYRAYARALAWRAGEHVRNGRLDEAVADAQEVLETDDHPEAKRPAAPARCEAELLRGNLAEARRALELGETAAWVDDPSWVGHLHARGLLHAADGDLDRALDDLLACGRLQDQVGATNAASLKWRSTGALIAQALGRTDLARTFAGEELELSRAWGAPRSLAISLLAAAEIGLGDRSDLLDEAVASAEGGTDPVVRCRALLHRGRLRAGAGDVAGSAEDLRRALELGEAAGALALTREVVDALEAAGIAAPRAPASPLTPSEARIAALARSGLTNRQIAEQSFITLSGVEFHLRNVYRKLGISGRGQLGQALSSDG